jgi:hypothetical protein
MPLIALCTAHMQLLATHCSVHRTHQPAVRQRRSASPRQGPHNREVGCEDAGQLNLVVERRHTGPRAQDVGDVVARQDVEILRREIILIPDLDGVPEPFRQRLEERIEPRQEVGWRAERLLVERPELEYERADLRAITLEPARKKLIEGSGVQEVLVREPGPFSVPSVCRPSSYRDVLGDLEAEDELRRRGVEQLRPVLLTRELVERQVTADRRKRLGIFRQAVFLELGFGELAARQVAILAVDAAAPALVLPRAGAEVDTLIGLGP